MEKLPVSQPAVGALIRRLRLAQGRSLKQVSSCSIAELSRIENGHHLPTLATLARLADELGHHLWIAPHE